VALPAVAVARRAAARLLLNAEHQSIDISCSTGSQQQTRSRGVRRANGADRRTDGHRIITWTPSHTVREVTDTIVRRKETHLSDGQCYSRLRLHHSLRFTALSLSSFLSEMMKTPRLIENSLPRAETVRRFFIYFILRK